MAAAATGMQVICGAGLSSRIVGLNQFVPLRSVQLFKRDLKFGVRSTAEVNIIPKVYQILSKRVVYFTIYILTNS